LAFNQQRVFDRLPADAWTSVPKGNPWGKPESWEVFAPRKLADELVQIGRALRHADGERYRAIRHDEIAAAKPDWIWLPNALVDGAAGETAPVELIRQTGSVETLRLLVELYRAHNLDENGGLHFRQIRQDYQRHKVGEWGPFVVWGFATDLVKAWPDAPFVAPHLTIERDEKGQRWRWTEFWPRWHRLHGLGLIEYVAHLVDADTQQGELMHPMALQNTGLEVERELFHAANMAAQAMITPGQLAWANKQGVVALAPVLRHIEGVQMLGIARLRYRPKTRRTQEFLSQEVEWREQSARYQQFALALSNHVGAAGAALG
jgi:hypothetical protein